MIKIISSFFIATLIPITLVAAPTLAAKPGGGHGGSTSSVLGNDMAWPQCGGSYPSGQAFGIVGVNAGKANDFNPCFDSQLAWAQGSSGTTIQNKTQLYLNTGNPGDVLAQYNVTDWPSSSVAADPYGPCIGNWTNNTACSWQYGYDRAQADVAHVASSAYKFWLDVETANSWTGDYAKNQAALEGMTYYLKSQGAEVGLYSTSYQWGLLIGTPGDGSNLNGLDSWLPGARNQKAAKSNCSLPPLTTGGSVILTQFVSRNVDYDYSCI